MGHDGRGRRVVGVHLEKEGFRFVAVTGVEVVVSDGVSLLVDVHFVHAHDNT